MSTATKIWLIVASVLVVIGVSVFMIALAKCGWDFASLGNTKYQTNTYEVDGAVQNVMIHTKTSDVVLSPSEEGVCRVVCVEAERLKHTVVNTNGTLSVTVEDTRKWYDHISFFSFKTPTITVYLPQSEYDTLSISEDTGDVVIPEGLAFSSIDVSAQTGDIECAADVVGTVRIKVSTGDVSVRNATAGAVEIGASTGDALLESMNVVGGVTVTTSTGEVTVASLSCKGDLSVRVSTGDTNLSDVTCKSLTAKGSTGDVILKNVIASEQFSIERSTGEVRFDRCDASEITVRTSTGDVSGTLLTEKVFLAHTDTGSVNVPKNAAGGKCEITTDTGDIKIELV